MQDQGGQVFSTAAPATPALERWMWNQRRRRRASLRPPSMRLPTTNPPSTGRARSVGQCRPDYNSPPRVVLALRIATKAAESRRRSRFSRRTWRRPPWWPPESRRRWRGWARRRSPLWPRIASVEIRLASPVRGSLHRIRAATGRLRPDDPSRRIIGKIQSACFGPVVAPPESAPPLTPASFPPEPTRDSLHPRHRRTPFNRSRLQRRCMRRLILHLRHLAQDRLTQRRLTHPPQASSRCPASQSRSGKLANPVTMSLSPNAILKSLRSREPQPRANRIKRGCQL